MKRELSVTSLVCVAARFARAESRHAEPSLYGVTDGKAVGTYLEQKFIRSCTRRFTFQASSAARGIDLPELGVDIKTTSIRQPQSSCPFQSARQKVYGLGHSLLVFAYKKTDVHAKKTSRLDIRHVIFIESERTADYQMTRGLRQIVENDANIDDVVAFLHDRLLPIGDVEAEKLAKEILRKPPEQGYLTISNALQWRLQYRRVIEMAGSVPGVQRVC